MDNQHEKPAGLVGCVKFFPKSVQACRRRLYRHHITDLGIMRERRPVIGAPMHRHFPEPALRSLDTIGNVIRHHRGFIPEPVLDQQINDLLVDIVHRSTVSRRLATAVFLVSGERTLEPVPLIRRLDRIFMQIPVMANFMTTFKDRLDSLRICFNAPARKKKGLLNAKPPIGFENTRNGHIRAIATHADRIEPVMRVIGPCNVDQTVCVHIKGHHTSASRAVWPWDRVLYHPCLTATLVDLVRYQSTPI